MVLKTIQECIKSVDIIPPKSFAFPYSTTTTAFSTPPDARNEFSSSTNFPKECNFEVKPNKNLKQKLKTPQKSKIHY